MSTRNIVLFGQSGAGKSSVINLMAGGGIAETSNSANHCTMHWKEHPIAFGGYNYEVFDTIGLEEPQLGIDGYLEAIKNAHNLITKLDNEGGIDLLLFCVRAGRITATVQNNYRLFHEFLCEKKVPIVLVLTGLERELENMEDWWDKNMQTFHKYNISVAGHACITSAENLEGRSQQLYEESRQLVRNLVRQHTYDSPKVAWKGDDGWLGRFIRKLRELLGKYTVRKKDMTTILTKRCGMPQETAALLAEQIKQDLS